MVLHQRSRHIVLKEFGIEIPVAPDRVGRLLAALREDPVLGPREAEWLRYCDGTGVGPEDLLLAHTKAYVEKIFSREVEEVLKEVFELVDAAGNYNRYDPATAVRPLAELFDPALTTICCGYQACTLALTEDFCFFLGGGAHHAHADFGHGFCMLNDVVVPLRKLQKEGRIRTAWVIDVDAHKGDGTAAITAGDPSIVSMSVHMARGWPLDGSPRDAEGNPNPAFVPSDIDVPIEEGEEETYLPRLAGALERLDGFPKADLALVVLGSDPYEHDGLPSTSLLRLSLDQMTARDMAVYRFLTERRIPAAYYMAGGYGERAWEPYAPFLRRVLTERLTDARTS